jgi:hypothetical protein
MNVSVVCYLKSDVTLEDFTSKHYYQQLFDKLEEATSNFEIVFVVARSDVKMIEKVNILLNISDSVRMEISDSDNVSKMYKLGVESAVYDYVMLLSGHRDALCLDFKHIFNKFIVDTYNKCFVVYDSNNTISETPMGIVFKQADFKSFSNIVNSKSELGVVKQIALAFCFLGHSYRINNTISMFELYPATIRYIKGASNMLKIFEFKFKRQFKDEVNAYYKAHGYTNQKKTKIASDF